MSLSKTLYIFPLHSIGSIQRHEKDDCGTKHHDSHFPEGFSISGYSGIKLSLKIAHYSLSILFCLFIKKSITL